MAHFTGQAVTVDELFTALINGCTANGWAWNSGILSSGDCFIKPYIYTSTIVLEGGTGQNGSNLVNQAATPQLKGYSSLAAIDRNLPYPLRYHLHVFATEVYLLVNYDVEYWSFIAFGQSPVAELIGTGTWFGGTSNGYASVASSTIANLSNTITCSLFSLTGDGRAPNSFFHHGLDGMEWSAGGTSQGDINSGYWFSSPSQANIHQVVQPLFNRQPNAWNGESILFPITPVINRAAGRKAIVGALKHAFIVRITNYTPGQIITIGNIRYMVCPWVRKDASQPNGSNNIYKNDHTGTYAIAVEYTGV